MIEESGEEDANMPELERHLDELASEEMKAFLWCGLSFWTAVWGCFRFPETEDRTFGRWTSCS